MSNIRNIIAKAIRKADRSYFFEDYTKQARAVLKTLEKEGYIVAPIKPTKEMVEEGADAILSGSVRPAKHVEDIYAAMTETLDKGQKKKA